MDVVAPNVWVVSQQWLSSGAV